MSFFVINRQYGFNPAIIPMVLMKKLVSVSGLGTIRNDLARLLNTNSVEQVKRLCHNLTQLKASLNLMEVNGFIVKAGSIVTETNKLISTATEIATAIS